MYHLVVEIVESCVPFFRPGHMKIAGPDFGKVHFVLDFLLIQSVEYKNQIGWTKSWISHMRIAKRRYRGFFLLDTSPRSV